MTAQLAVDGPATTIIDNFIAMLERDRVQRGRYVHPDPEPDTGQVCHGFRACAVGSLWIGAGVEPYPEDALLEDEQSWFFLPGVDQGGERERFLYERPALGKAYDALNEAAGNYAVVHGLRPDFALWHDPIEAVFETTAIDRDGMLEIARRARKLLEDDSDPSDDFDVSDKDGSAITAEEIRDGDITAEPLFPVPDAFGGVHPSVDGAPGDAEDIIERLGEAVKDNLRECLGDTGSLARPTRLEPETPSEPSPAFLSDLWARLQDTYPEADDARRELLRAPEDPNFAREFVLANSDPSEPRDDALTAAFGVGLCLGVLREREHATTHLFIWHDGTIYALSNPSDPDERGYFRGHYALLATPELVASDAEYVTNPSGERLIGGFFTNDGTLVSL